MYFCNVVKLKRIYTEMDKAKRANDTESLGKIPDDSFVLVHMTGTKDP